MNRQTYKDLIRATDDRIIAGVCAGLADFFGLDTSTVRLATPAADPLRRTLALGLHHPVDHRAERTPEGKPPVP